VFCFYTDLAHKQKKKKKDNVKRNRNAAVAFPTEECPRNLVPVKYRALSTVELQHKLRTHFRRSTAACSQMRDEHLREQQQREVALDQFLTEKGHQCGYCIGERQRRPGIHALDACPQVPRTAKDSMRRFMTKPLWYPPNGSCYWCGMRQRYEKHSIHGPLTQTPENCKNRNLLAGLAFFLWSNSTHRDALQKHARRTWAGMDEFCAWLHQGMHVEDNARPVFICLRYFARYCAT
jgi:hypothetical protein